MTRLYFRRFKDVELMLINVGRSLERAKREGKEADADLIRMEQAAKRWAVSEGYSRDRINSLIFEGELAVVDQMRGR